MLQYIINTTAIWLLSLMVFDLFLRRESYHTYNRFYLLFTLALGSLLPLWQWQGNDHTYAASVRYPVERVIAAKQTIVAAATTDNTVSGAQWLWVIYISGVVVALLMVAVDVTKLVAYYHSGRLSKKDNRTVIETGKDHAPFSFMNLLFVSSTEQYTDDEWQMIAIHEGQHSRLVHFADLLLLQFCKIVFWFHPLVYVYANRLLLVHEYQADHTASTQPIAYGKFLIEQAILKSAPTVAHSFNRSPIKKRIVMLTSRSSTIARIKMLLLIPLAAICVVCFSQSGFARKFEKRGNMVTYNGNKFELSEPKKDTIIIIDPVTGGEITKYMSRPPAPIKMNGIQLPIQVDKQPYFTGNEKNLREYLLKNLRNELVQLKDGMYSLNISNVLIGKNGKVVYFDYFDLSHYNTINGLPEDIPLRNRMDSSASKPGSHALVSGNPDPLYENISNPLQDRIYKEVCRLMENAPAYIPAKLGGKNAVFQIPDMNMFGRQFEIKDHKLYDWDGKLVL